MFYYTEFTYISKKKYTTNDVSKIAFDSRREIDRANACTTRRLNKTKAYK